MSAASKASAPRHWKTSCWHRRIPRRTRRLAPFVVLTELEEVLPPPPDYKSQFIFAGAFFFGLLLLVWIIIRDDSTKQEFQRRRKGRKIGEA